MRYFMSPSVFISFMVAARASPECNTYLPITWYDNDVRLKMRWESHSKSMMLMNLMLHQSEEFSSGTDQYTGFAVYNEQSCGSDFLSKLSSGEIGFDFLDTTAEYTPQYAHRNNQTVTIQWKRDSLSGTMGNEKKDQMYFLLSGLDAVNFGDKDKTACLLSAELGAGSISLADQDQTACVQLNPVLPIVSGLCESDPCLNVAWQNNWDTDSYNQCAADYIKNRRASRKLRSLSHSQFKFDVDCPFIQCAAIHDLSDQDSRKAYRDCVDYNAARMPSKDVQLQEEVAKEVNDTCTNYSEAWGTCQCRNDIHIGCNYNIPGFQTFPNEPDFMGTKMLLVTNYSDPLANLVNLGEPSIGNDVYISQLKHFNPGKKTLIITHGYNSYRKELYNMAASLKLKGKGWNVIMAEWKEGAKEYALISDNFSRACSNTRIVGRQVANFISLLVQARLVAPEDVHLVGHSLGAHVIGYTGKWFNQMYDQRLGRITGLDPAGLKFAFKNPIHNYVSFPWCAWKGCKWDLTEEEKRRNRIDRTDADFVDVIHTAAAFVASMMDPLGHVDFYPNGGDKFMAAINENCYHLSNITEFDYDEDGGDELNYMDSIETTDFIGTCPHFYAVDYFIASVHNKCYTTKHCDSYDEYLAGNCYSDKLYQMGFWAEKGESSDDNQQRFYMTTELDCWKNEQNS